MIWSVTTIAAAILLVGVVAEFGVIIGQSKEIGRMRTQIDNNQHVIAQVNRELDACTVTKGSVLQSLDECLAEVRVAGEENATARSSLDQLTEHIRQESAHVRREREVVFRQPGCQELASLDVASVCPDLAGSLRARAAEMSASGKGTNADPSAP